MFDILHLDHLGFFILRKKCQMQSVRIKAWLSVIASTVHLITVAICMRYCIQNHHVAGAIMLMVFQCIIDES
jgi:hypothetical protein